MQRRVTYCDALESLLATDEKLFDFLQMSSTDIMPGGIFPVVIFLLYGSVHVR